MFQNYHYVDLFIYVSFIKLLLVDKTYDFLYHK